MDLKKMLEKRAELVGNLDALFKACEAEKRGLNADEIAKYDTISNEIKGIDTTIKAFEEARSLGKNVPGDTHKKVDPAIRLAEKEQFALECRAFSNYLRNNGETNYKEERAAAVNMTMGDNGAVIPATIAKKIIETVENICPIYHMAAHFSVKGDLTFPVYDESTDKVTCAYANEFTALESHTGKFTKITLKGFLAGALTKISRSLVNNVDFDLASYVISKVSLAIARFLEHELLLGTGSNAMKGVIPALAGTAQEMVAASATAISADDLIALQVKVPQQYQENACFIVNTNTLLAIRKLKDQDGRYLLQDDLTRGFGYTLLGKTVYLSDAMADMAKNAKAVVYGDFSGITVNVKPDVEIQLLLERYADEHAIGVVAWIEADANVTEVQKVAVLKMAAV